VKTQGERNLRQSIFNASISIALIPLSLRGVRYKASRSPAAMLRPQPPDIGVGMGWDHRGTCRHQAYRCHPVTKPIGLD